MLRSLFRRLAIAVSCVLLLTMSLTPSFNPGDAIQYTTYIYNSSSQPVTMKITFDAIGPTGPNEKDIYLYTQGGVKVPPGLSGWYSPSTVPTSAPGGTYAVGIGLSDSSDGAFDDADVFTITPVGRLVIPSTGTVFQLFLETCSKCTHETWYPSYYDQNNTLQPRPSGGAHSGVDISAAQQDCLTSKPVYAAGEGEVIWAGWAGAGFGWSVIVKHGYGFNGNRHYTYTLYGHMGTVGTNPATDPKKGSVSCLQVSYGNAAYPSVLLGYQGSSGLSSEATHVHFMIFAGDQSVGQGLTRLSSPYDLVNKYSIYPASPDFYTCMQLTAGDSKPVGYVNIGDNNC